MTPEMQKYIDLLESQLGYSEKGGAYTKFGDWYGKTVEFDADYSAAPWCDMYLSWAAHKLGYEDWIGQFAWTVRHAEWFKAQGAWGKTPKPGAFVFYDWSGSGRIDNIDHVGIVTKVQGDTIFTIEGNIDGGVAKRKERDTSKVVGYGYPERIKARLDEEAAQKRADEQAAMPARPGTDVGTLHLPGSSLSSLIPHVDRNDHPAPLAAPKTTGDSSASTGGSSAGTGNSTTGGSSATTDGSSTSTGSSPSTGSSASTGGSSASATGESSRTSAEAATRGGGPVASTGPTSAAGKSSATKPKHAKATTADTTSTTAEPLPTHVDASASSPLPSIASPTLVGSALVAALALLALTKTRLRPSLAAARASRPTPRTAATVSRTRATAPSEAEPQRGGGSRPGRGSHAAPGRRRRRRPSDLRGASTRSPQFLDRDEPTFPTTFEPASTESFESTFPTTFEPASTESFEPAFPTTFEPALTESFEPAFPTSFDPATTDAFQRVVIPVADGGFEPVIIPAATSAFEPFTERKAVDTGPMVPVPAAAGAGEERTGISATYRGRRRRQEEPAEGFAPFEARPRGRRHRRTPGAPENPWSLDRVTGTSPVNAFIQEIPLRGRRHRGQTDQDRLVGSA